MGWLRLNFFVLLVWFSAPVGAQAWQAQATEDLAAQTVTSPVVFAPMNGAAFPATVKMTNGQPVKAEDWRPLMVAKVGEYVLPDGSKKDNTCTASLVGPGVLLTAAHCLDFKELTKATPIVKAGFAARETLTITLTCLLPTEYLESDWAGRSPRNAHDYALCVFTMPENPPKRLANLRYEVIDTSRSLAADDPVLMTGFGCKTLYIGANGLEGRDDNGAFTVADSRITNDASAYGVLEIVAPMMKRAALCPGDSGGPLMSGASVANQTGSRRIAAINSSIAQQDSVVIGEYDVRSGFAPLSTPTFAAYRQRWSKLNATAWLCDQSTAKEYPCRK